MKKEYDKYSEIEEERLMKERTLRILEFNKIKDKIKKYAITQSGKELVRFS